MRSAVRTRGQCETHPDVVGGGEVEAAVRLPPVLRQLDSEGPELGRPVNTLVEAAAGPGQRLLQISSLSLRDSSHFTALSTSIIPNFMSRRIINNESLYCCCYPLLKGSACYD